ncbi:MAG TPA: nucleotide exchange factor GrpE [Thermoleophilaceae bacterium]
MRSRFRDRDDGPAGAGERETAEGRRAAAEEAAAPAEPAAEAGGDAAARAESAVEAGGDPAAPDGDPAAPDGDPAAPAAEPEPAEPDPLARAEAERDEYLALAQRTQADFENYRKRAAKEAAGAGERAKVGLLRELLPVVDNLERALRAADEESPLAEGVRLVLSELQGVLAREGVEALEPAGEQFDPTVHEALSTRSEDGAEAGVVLDVVEKGYRTRDTVIRPARVVVSA